MIKVYDIDEGGNNPMLSPVELPINELKNHVDYYREYVADATRKLPESVNVVTTISLDTINDLLELNPDSNAIRIYMGKETQLNDSEVRFLIVPAIKDTSANFTDSIAEGDGTIFRMKACPSNACPPATRNFSLTN